MGWMEYSASLVGSLAWPAAVLVVGLVLVARFRAEIGDVISRVTAVKAAGLDVEVGARVKAAAAAAVRTEIDSGALIEGIPQRVTEAGPPQPDLQQRVDDAIEKDEARRRAEVEQLIAASVQEGWSLAYMGFRTPPVPVVTWDEAGNPSIKYSSSDGSPPMMHNLNRLVGARTYPVPPPR